MKLLRNLEELNKLEIVSSDNEVEYFESFMFLNPETEKTFPKFDSIYYEMLEAHLLHLHYKFKKGWITSERQVLYSSDECITTVHFVEYKDSLTLNIFQRSSNIANIKEDMQFFNYLLNKHFSDSYKETKFNVFVSMPHKFKNKKYKIEG